MKCFGESASDVIGIYPVMTAQFEQWLTQQNSRVKVWLDTYGFKAEPGSFCLVPDEFGKLAQIFLGVESDNDTWAYGILPMKLAQGTYAIKVNLSETNQQLAAVAWGLGSYRFTVYKKAKPSEAKLILGKKINKKLIENTINSCYLIRDLINTPTEDMGPAELARAADKLADEFSATVEHIVGDKLLKQNYPCVHAVGRASVREPRLIDLHWGKDSDPKLTLVGKGVCFDSGGLDIKTTEGMADMNKDMGGAAHVLGLARMIMTMKLPVRLRVMIAAVENLLAGASYKPGDILTTRKGLTVEVTNTDAEGRLILCDMLSEASSEKPELLIDFATLTGAARIALGTTIAALFSNDDALAHGILQKAEEYRDPICRLPLYKPYRSMLDSKKADMHNSPETRYGGAITASLFLQEFIDNGVSWAHFDVMASNIEDMPGRPKGGEAMGIRATFAYLQERFR